jgi:outer membrane protein OmpA-like peptidoglycan-associated protein
VQQHHVIITFTLIGVLFIQSCSQSLTPREPEGYLRERYFDEFLIFEGYFQERYFDEFLIFFESNSDMVKEKYYPDLDKIESKLPLLRDVRDPILIQGNTDSIESAFNKQLLSEKRAESVKRYLVQRFPLLSKRRLIVRGYGSTRPLASNDTEEGRSKNRYVSIFVIPYEYTFPKEPYPIIGALGPSIISGTGRADLVEDQPEDQDYGLYSYLLFASPPTEATRERYQAAVTAYLYFLSPVRLSETYLQRRLLNITYLPLTVRRPEGIRPKESTEWVLEHYNYSRARILLSSLPGAHNDGPYIVSSREPFRVGKILAEPYLYQDLSWVPPRLVELWVKAFLHQVMQKRFWEERTAERWVRYLRTVIAILAEGLPEIQTASAELPKKRLNVQEELMHRIIGNHESRRK